jgi:iron complex transport system substrate-binding protein
MRIVSLIPSATEIVFALGLGDQLEGVTFECDFPPEARSKAVVSGSALPAAHVTGEQLTPREIDDAVSATVGDGEPIYTLDVARIGAIAPDLILAQDLCRVCAVPSGAVEDALDVLGCRADVVSLDPVSLDDVIGCIGAVGDATGTADVARDVMHDLRTRVDAVRTAVDGRRRVRVLALEWSDPPFSGGHWVPDMIDAAGGMSLLAAPGARSERLEWSDIAAAQPEVVVFMPCGYDLARAVEEGAALRDRHELARASLWAADANALFSRPGPRIVDGVEALATILHPEVAPVPAAARHVTYLG